MGEETQGEHDEEDDEEPVEDEPVVQEVEYNKLKVSELKAIAEAKGLTNYKSLKKQPLIDHPVTKPNNIKSSVDTYKPKLGKRKCNMFYKIIKNADIYGAY